MGDFEDSRYEGFHPCVDMCVGAAVCQVLVLHGPYLVGHFPLHELAEPDGVLRFGCCSHSV